MTPRPLTARELAALRHIALGGTVRSLATALCLSQAGAAMLLSRIYKRLEVSNGTHAVYRAVSTGLIPTEQALTGVRR